MRKVCIFFLLLVVGILFSGLRQEEVKAAKYVASTNVVENVKRIEENGVIPSVENGYQDLTIATGVNATIEEGNPVTINGTLTLEKGAVLNVYGNVTINGDINRRIKIHEANVVTIADGAQINIISGTVRIGTEDEEEVSNVTKIIENYGLVRLNLLPGASLLISKNYELRLGELADETDEDKEEADNMDKAPVIVDETIVPEEEIMEQSEDTGFLSAIYFEKKWQDYISCEYCRDGIRPKGIIEDVIKNIIKENFNLSDYGYMFCDEEKIEFWNVQNDYYKYEAFTYQPKRIEEDQQITYQDLQFYINVKVVPTNIPEGVYPEEKRNLVAQAGNTLADVKNQLLDGFAFVDDLTTPVGAAGGTYAFDVNYAEDNQAINYNPIQIKIVVTDAEQENPSKPIPSTPVGDPTVETPKPSVPIPSRPVPEIPSTANEGKCGNNVTYRYKAGVLTISGKGAMADLFCENTKTLKEDASAGRKSSYGGMDAYAAKVKKIVIEGGVTRIGRGAFAYFKNLESVQIKGSKTAKVSVGQYAFARCEKLRKVSMKNVKEINFFAFGNCKALKKLTLRKGLTSIGKSAFYGCKKLKSITLPSTVKEIGDYCFYGCKKLKTVKVNGNIKKAGKYMFYSAGKKAVIRCVSKKANKCKFVKKANAEGIKIKRK